MLTELTPTPDDEPSGRSAGTSTLSAPSDNDAARVAVRWLSRFELALNAGDRDALSQLFTVDAIWRDILSFTWSLRTLADRDTALDELASRQRDVAAHDFRAAFRTPPRYLQRAGTGVVEAFFDFDTAVGRGRGVVRLVPAETSAETVGADTEPWRCWTILTSLQELTGHEETVGDRRPTGREYSRRFGGDNWLDERIAARSYADHDPEVVVVGGGQGGLTLAARLGQLGVDTLIVDRMARVGDNWRSRYHSLTLHDPVWVNHLPYLPFPASWPEYIPKDKLANWFEAYVEIMELSFWTQTEFLGGYYDEQERRWTIRLRNQDGERTMRPRHVILATGVSGLPRIPDLPGLSEFAGDVVHSSGFNDGALYQGKRAVVVGAGNSGHDVAQDLHSHGAAVTMIQRSPTTVVSIEPSAALLHTSYLQFEHLDDCDLSNAATPYPVHIALLQQLTEVWRDLDRDLIKGLENVGFRTDYGDDHTGLRMKYLRRGGGYYINVGCSDLIVSGKIGLLPAADVARFVVDGVELADGTVVPADLLVFATGYQTIQDSCRRYFGDAIADRVGPVWGLDDEGELRNMWRPTPQPGLWFHAGSLAQCRAYSKYLALAVKADLENIS